MIFLEYIEIFHYHTIDVRNTLLIWAPVVELSDVPGSINNESLGTGSGLKFNKIIPRTIGRTEDLDITMLVQKTAHL